jgi:PAS domain S-box-containing protein
MLHRLLLSHRLLLIYLLSFVSVVVLAYGLIVEKNIAIRFAQKELRGSAYVAVVRDALLAVMADHLSLASPTTGAQPVGGIALREHAEKVLSAEARYGAQMRTDALADGLATLLRELDQNGARGSDPHGTKHLETLSAAKSLIVQIGDDSNLILDPDLDSYYMMSIATLRLPEFVMAAAELADAAILVQDDMPSDGAWIRFYVTKGMFDAAASALTSDNARALDAETSESRRALMQAAFVDAQSEVTDFLIELQKMLIARRPADTAPVVSQAMIQGLMHSTAKYWRHVGDELDRLLQRRIERFYARMAIDLGIAGVVWFAALALILVLARQITRPVRELATVAERIRHDDYSVRAKARTGGEIGSLVTGFNDMLDRLQRETANAQERVARDRAAVAERQLLEAIPVVMSVVRESDGEVLYANLDPSRPTCLPRYPDGRVCQVLEAMYPADRRALLAAYRLRGQVDGFEARCRRADGGDLWVLVGARPLTYQGEAARLDVYIPIDDRKHAEEALARRNAVLDAITYAAARIINAGDWRITMPEFLARLGTATGAGRAFLFEIHPAPAGEGLAQSCRFMWSARGVKPIVDSEELYNEPIPEVGESQFADWHKRRSRGETIQIRFRDTYEDGRKTFEQSGTLSMLSVPVMVEGEYWGSLGFDDCEQERVWEDSEVDLLKTATALIAGAIGRERADALVRDRDCKLIEAQRIAHIGSWELDFATDRVTWSDEGWRIFGLEPGHTPWSHEENLARIHPEDRTRVAEIDAAARNGSAPIEMEYRILRPDGEIRVVHERAEVMYDDAGRPTRLIGTVHDITELKETEAKLRESEERYTLAARGADVGLWDLDLLKDRAYLSPRLHEILCAGDRDLNGSISKLLDEFLPDDVSALRQHLADRYARQRHRFEFEVRTRKPAADPRWLQLRGLIVYKNENPVRIVGSLRDITDRKRAAEEIARQREALHQSEKMAMFGSLLAGVAHELNNPLSVVIGQIALLRETTSDPAVVQRAERIRNATERCARIVRTFLAMARQRQLEPKPTDVNDVVEMAVELLAYQLRAAKIDIHLDLANDLPVITADSDQVHQVLTNLIVNAQQALGVVDGRRRIRISTRFERYSQFVSIRVIDNGPGIPPDIRSRIFEPFFTTKPVGEGSGIGLSLCQSIVSAHGGRIEVSNDLKGGAVFTVVLPVGKPSAQVVEPTKIDCPLKTLRVLVIDDEPEIADTITEILRNHGHSADSVGDGREGLKAAQSGTYDLIISDIRMPLVDGRELYEVLRQTRPEMADRTAFVTGDTLSAEIQSFLAETMAPYIEKPFLPADVLELLRQTMERRTIRQQPSVDQAKRAG